MKKKSVELVNTGIFEEYQVTGRMSDREFQKLAKWIRENGSVEGQISYYEKAALRILRKYRIMNWSTEESIRKYLRVLKQRPKDLALRDASAVLGNAEDLRKCIASNNTQWAARYALQLGCIGTRMLIRHQEFPAVKGRQVLDGGAKGRASKARESSNAAINHDAWGIYAKQIRTEYDNGGQKLSQRRLAYEICKRCYELDGDVVKFETVRKALQKQSAK